MLPKILQHAEAVPYEHGKRQQDKPLPKPFFQTIANRFSTIRVALPVLFAGISIAALLTATVGYGFVSRAARVSAGESMWSLHLTTVTAVQMWLDRHGDQADTIARMPTVHTAANQFIHDHVPRANSSRNAVSHDRSATQESAQVATQESTQGEDAFGPTHTALTAALARATAATLYENAVANPDTDDRNSGRARNNAGENGGAKHSVFGWALILPDGRVLASNVDSLRERRLPIPDDVATHLEKGESTVGRPFPSSLIDAPEDVSLTHGGMVMYAISPVLRGARLVGALAWLIDPATELFPLLTSAQSQTQSESYALDRNATLLTPSRYTNSKRNAGNPPSARALGEPIRIVVPRESGQAGGSANGESRSLTKLADRVTRGATGRDIQGYVNYAGETVIGAWTWIPRYDIGIATETDVSQVDRPAFVLRRGAWATCLLAFVGLAIVEFKNRILNAERSSTGSIPGQRQLGQYQLLETIGRGGMGTVFRGRHRLLKRDVAVKVLKNSDRTSIAVSRFDREVQLTARLRHHNTVAVYDYGHTADGTLYYVMEYVEGITLQTLVDDHGPQPPQRVVHLLRQICGALSEAHQMGLVHRDIKPMNILLTARAGLFDMVKVLDFGLVKPVQNEDDELTSTEGITGTPMYMSPESVRDASLADARSDLYSVAAVGYTLLTGKPLFDGESSVDVCLMQLNDQPQRPSDRLGKPLPEDLQNVLMSCLHKEPDHRPPSIDDLDAALRDCQCAESWTVADAIRWWEVEYPEQAIQMGDPDLSN